MTTPASHKMTVLQLKADMLAVWLEEALRDPLVTEEAFHEKVERHREVLCTMKRLRYVGDVVYYA